MAVLGDEICVEIQFDLVSDVREDDRRELRVIVRVNLGHITCEGVRVGLRAMPQTSWRSSAYRVY